MRRPQEALRCWVEERLQEYRRSFERDCERQLRAAEETVAQLSRRLAQNEERLRSRERLIQELQAGRWMHLAGKVGDAEARQRILAEQVTEMSRKASLLQQRVGWVETEALGRKAQEFREREEWMQLLQLMVQRAETALASLGKLLGQWRQSCSPGRLRGELAQLREQLLEARGVGEQQCSGIGCQIEELRQALQQLRREVGVLEPQRHLCTEVVPETSKSPSSLIRELFPREEGRDYSSPVQAARRRDLNDFLLTDTCPSEEREGPVSLDQLPQEERTSRGVRGHRKYFSGCLWEQGERQGDENERRVQTQLAEIQSRRGGSLPCEVKMDMRGFLLLEEDGRSLSIAVNLAEASRLQQQKFIRILKYI